ncbi:MAG TPA: glycoside hydrolase family 15 protein [Vicinamibacterales bacterium]|nr:glycoside hydrolase family 15 protein [Vicinamibacterales bacterium]
MALRIEDYGLIGDTHTAALVGRDGSIDWLCLPRFDSGSCFSALLGDESHGRWLIAPVGPVLRSTRRYRPGTLILETEMETADGVVRIVDFMPPRVKEPDLVRIVEGVRGTVAMQMQLVIRFDYGRIVPWVRTIEERLVAIGGPDALTLVTPVATYGKDLTTRAEFTVREGSRVPFVLMWHPSHESAPEAPDAMRALDDTTRFWTEWSGRCDYHGSWREQVVRSSITLKALTYAPTGGIVAAPTTSLPEQLSGVRNWDYRYCWLRDATYTLYALMIGGYTDEALAWRNWLLRAVAGDPATLQTMYGVRGERRLTERELSYLPGYEQSRPVRVGNAAVEQLQLDVYGEVMDALHVARRHGLTLDPDAWSLQKTLLEFLENAWQEPDEGIWEVRGPRRHFTHSKVMTWVAFDRAVKAVERFGLDAPVERWRRVRDEIHERVCRDGVGRERNCFTQYFGAKEVDASLLMLPLVGFVPATDPRMLATVAAIEQDLLFNGFVRRYRPKQTVDGLPGGEGVFLACTFWLGDNYSLQGRHEEAARLFERLVGLCNDLGLLSEEYDVVGSRFLGNFPQAFSHVMLINSARNLSNGSGPAAARPHS